MTESEANAPLLSIERLYASPSLNGPTPKGVKFSPDGQRVTFLKAREEDSSRYDLWQFDVATGEQSLLVDSKILEPEEVELSEEEKALRERKRIAGQKGIVSYDWGTADTILVPIGGDLWLVTLVPPELKIKLKPEADKYGVTLADISEAVRQTYYPDESQTLPRDPDIRFMVKAPSQPQIPIGEIPITTSNGEQLLLADVAKIIVETSEPKARRLTETEAFEYDARVSPLGNYVSFVRDGAVYAIKLSTGEETRLTPEADPENAISYGVAEFVAQEEMSRYTGYWWSPDEAYLAFTKVDESTVDIIPRFDIRAEDVAVIEQRYPRAGRPNAIVDLFVRDMKSGETNQLMRFDEDNYLARVNWTNGNKIWWQHVNRDQTEIKYYQSSMPWRIWSPFTETQENWVNLSNDFVDIDRDYVLITEETPQAPMHSMVEDENGQMVRVYNPPEAYRHIHMLTKANGAKAIITEGKWAVSAIEAVDTDTKTVYFTGWKDTPLEKHLYAVSYEFGGQIQEAVRLTEAGKSWSITMSPDGKSFVGTSSSPTQPPQTGLYRIDTATMVETHAIPADEQPLSVKRQAIPIAWIEENKLDESHPYFPYLESHTVPDYGTLEAEDGQTLYYSIQKPPNFDPAKKYPVIIEVYGGPHVQTVTRNWERLSDVFYTHQGYIVFRLDNRGSYNRGKRFEDVIYRQTGKPEVADQLVGVDWLKAQPFVDADRVAIQGWSYGGYMTLMTSLQAPEGTFAAAVSGAPVTDWTLYDTFYTERYMDTPENNPDGYEASSVFPYVDNLTFPLLLIHGMADDNVTFDNSTRLMAEMQQKGLPFELMTYPGQRHGIRGEELQIHLMKTRMNFLNRHLKD